MDTAPASASGAFVNRKLLIGLGITVLVLIVVVALLLLAYQFQPANSTNNYASSSSSASGNNDSSASDSAAVDAGKRLSNNNCTGTGTTQLTVAPMNSADFAYYQPYGLMVGAHVTPIDHGYFSPADPQSPRDKYPVYAMADAKVVDIGHRGSFVGNADVSSRPTDEYRIVFSYSCTFFSYYDLITSLSPTLKAAYDAKQIDVDVKAGDIIGYIGGQTLDFAVWDTTKPLTGYIKPENYQGEAWKIYTANPFDYMSADLKALILSKDLRQVEPRQGKIDYDVKGKLIGNWFQKDTNGYAGVNQANYWVTHLAFAPDYIDPTVFTISVGEYKGNATQFGALGNTPNPADVGVDSGLVKYNLVQQSLAHKNGSGWQSGTYASDLIMQNQSRVMACMLVQLTDADNLKEEVFADKNCSAVSGFDANAKIYQR